MRIRAGTGSAQQRRDKLFLPALAVMLAAAFTWFLTERSDDRLGLEAEAVNAEMSSLLQRVHGSGAADDGRTGAAGEAPVDLAEAALPHATGGQAVPGRGEEPSGSHSAGSAAPESEQASASAGKLDLNRASVEQLVGLPGIGETKARAIVEYREKNGPFRKAEELMNVKGIGEKTFEKLQPLVTVGAEAGND